MATWQESVVKVEPPEIDDTCENRMGGGNSLSPTLVNVDSKEVIDFNTDVIKKDMSVNNVKEKSNAKSYLKINGRTQTCVTPYSCIHCDMNFTTREDLMRHEQVHTQYSCRYCHKKLSTKHHLKQHERVHTAHRAMFKLGGKNLIVLCLLIKIVW